MMNFKFVEGRAPLFKMSSPHNHTHQPYNSAVLPITERLRVDARFTGRGVRMAFLDSGFYPHDDLENRIVAFHDVAGEETAFEKVKSPPATSWHGTQTTVVAAGSGKLSDGMYRGIASSAELVLVKVSENGRIKDKHLERGLEWILANHKKYQIRILNISLGA
ncbi:MAG: S8 family serine peptidase, partial [Pyrinomonadaceae bacterium]